MNAPSDGAIRLFCANVTGIESNCNYPNERQITGEEALEAAVARDYVVARFKNSYRNTANFLSANCLCKDCDNDHSDNPADWVTPEDVRRAFPDVTLAIHYTTSGKSRASRSHSERRRSQGRGYRKPAIHPDPDL